MFGLGVPELILIFVVALIVFGPKRLPEIGRTIGKTLAEFKKATDDLKNTVEREVRLDELRQLTPTITPIETVSRTEPAPPAIAEGPAAPSSAPATPASVAPPTSASVAPPTSAATDATPNPEHPTEG